MKKTIDGLVGKVDKILDRVSKMEVIESDMRRIEAKLKEIEVNMVSEEEFKPYKTSWDIIWKAVMMALA
jgi:hypothetical protein